MENSFATFPHFLEVFHLSSAVAGKPSYVAVKNIKCFSRAHAVDENLNFLLLVFPSLHAPSILSRFYDYYVIYSHTKHIFHGKISTIIV